MNSSFQGLPSVLQSEFQSCIKNGGFDKLNIILENQNIGVNIKKSVVGNFLDAMFHSYIWRLNNESGHKTFVDSLPSILSLWKKRFILVLKNFNYGKEKRTKFL
eukprot:UN28800